MKKKKNDDLTRVDEGFTHYMGERNMKHTSVWVCVCVGLERELSSSDKTGEVF